GKKDTKISMQVSDLDQTPSSASAMQVFDSLKNVELLKMPLEKAQENIKKGDQACVLVIHKGFSDSLTAGKELPLELQYDEAQEIQVGLLQQSLIPTIAMLPFNIGNPKAVMRNRFDKMVPGASDTVKQNIQHKSDGLFDAITMGEMQSDGNDNAGAGLFGGDIKMTKLVAAEKDNSLGLVQAVAGTAVMMLLFSVVGIGAGILDEKQEGTLKRLLYTPMNPIKILFGKMISANVISIFQLVVMFLFASLVFGLDIYSHL